MASKKRKKQRSRQRQAATSWSSGVAPAETETGVISSPVPASTRATSSAPKVAPAYASGISGPRRPAATATSGSIDIDARVPYFASDLRRVLITAAVMIVLIVVGSLLIH